VKPVLLDTGVIVALLDRSEKFHNECARTIRELESPLITCEAVIAESCYLLRNLAGAAEAVIDNVAEGIFQVPFQLSREASGVKQLLRKYRDRKIDLADACLIRLADEFETGDILTLDRDFAVYRWSKNRPFRILPDWGRRVGGCPRCSLLAVSDVFRV
jgi:predicted nucleic acid-binding protein